MKNKDSHKLAGPDKMYLYQCPYELVSRCDLYSPCMGCETFARAHKQANKKRNR